VATHYLYDGVRLLAETDAAGTVTRSYTLAPIGGEWYPLVSDRFGAASRWYAFDALGTTRALTDHSQLTTHQFTDDAWGNVLSASDPAATPHQYIGRYGYYANGTSGLMLLTQRYYDGGVGRFASEDLIRSGTNWFGYARSRPPFFIDPQGLDVSHGGGGRTDPFDPFDDEFLDQFDEDWRAGEEHGAVRPPRLPPHLRDCRIWRDWRTYVCGGLQTLACARCSNRAAEDAFRVSDATGLPGRGRGPRDAYRHCVWSCLMVQRCGCFCAHEAGAAHEIEGSLRRPPQPLDELIMDTHNNVVGRAIGDRGGNCASECLRALRDGYLMVLQRPTWR